MHYRQSNPESELHKGLLMGMKATATRLEAELPNYFNMEPSEESQKIQSMITTLRSNLESKGHLSREQYEWLLSLKFAWKNPTIAETRKGVMNCISILVSRSVDVLYEELRACRNNEFDAYQKLSKSGKTLIMFLIKHLLKETPSWDAEKFQTASCILKALQHHQKHFKDYSTLKEKFDVEKQNFKLATVSDRIEASIAMTESAELERAAAEKAMNVSDENELASEDIEEIAKRWEEALKTRKTQRLKKTEAKKPKKRRIRRSSKRSSGLIARITSLFKKDNTP